MPRQVHGRRCTWSVHTAGRGKPWSVHTAGRGRAGRGRTCCSWAAQASEVASSCRAARSSPWTKTTAATRARGTPRPCLEWCPYLFMVLLSDQGSGNAPLPSRPCPPTTGTLSGQDAGPVRRVDLESKALSKTRSRPPPQTLLREFEFKLASLVKDNVTALSSHDAGPVRRVDLESKALSGGSLQTAHTARPPHGRRTRRHLPSRSHLALRRPS